MKHLRNSVLAGLLAVSAFLTVSLPASSAAANAMPAASVAAAPGDIVTAHLPELVDALPVQDEGPRDGYSREQSSTEPTPTATGEARTSTHRAVRGTPGNDAADLRP